MFVLLGLVQLFMSTVVPLVEGRAPTSLGSHIEQQSERKHYVHNEANCAACVRAEMSRLRRSLGGLLSARPYRLAPDVDVTLPDLATSTFVRNSTAPGVRAPRRDPARRATRLQPLPGE